MFGNSTDLLIRRFMVRIAKPVYACAGVVVLVLASLPFLPKVESSWLDFLGQLHPFCIPLPMGASVVLLTVEIGRLFSKEWWNPYTVWLSFFVSLMCVPYTVTAFYWAPAMGELQSMTYAWGSLVATLGVIFSFLLRYGAVITRQRVLDQAYRLFFVVAAVLLLYQGMRGAVLVHGNPFDNVPW